MNSLTHSCSKRREVDSVSRVLPMKSSHLSATNRRELQFPAVLAPLPSVPKAKGHKHAHSSGGSFYKLIILTNRRAYFSHKATTRTTEKKNPKTNSSPSPRVILRFRKFVRHEKENCPRCWRYCELYFSHPRLHIYVFHMYSALTFNISMLWVCNIYFGLNNCALSERGRKIL